MASGKKNYFRHSFHARKHEEIARLIDDHGKEAYFHFFVLCEICAERASDRFPEDNLFIFRRSTLCRELLVTNSRLSRHLLTMVPSLVDDIVVTENDAKILFPKLRKYMGRYETKLDSNSPNKRKEKEIKENKIIISEPEKNLPKKDSQQILKKASPLSFLFGANPEIQAWLNEGVFETHTLLLKKYSHHELVDLVQKAFGWAEPRKIKAETWLYTFVSNKNTHGYGLNQPQKSFSKKGHGVMPSDQNPTGNPYVQEAIEKGLVG